MSEIKKEDNIHAEARVMAVLKSVYPKAYSGKAIQRNCQLYWKKNLETIGKLVNEGKIEKIETSNYSLYRIKVK